ncbi:MAG: T9SS type A sorting domain-containing protein, partial [Flavobacteriales bacterium]|nr:T9SS type A sorting domain-containing protein [Flavobacteriales bacterium]
TGAWSGVRILDFDNVPSLGDDVTITGTVEENFDFTRITGVQTYINNGPSTVPSWTELGTFALNDEQYEGVLVRTSGECTAGWNNFEEWFISDGSGDIMINDEMYQFEPTVGTNYQVTGPLNYAFSAFKIEPRDMDDVSVVSSVDELSTLDFSVFPNPVSDFLTVNHDENESVFLQLFDSNGRVVLNERLDTGASNIDIRSLAAGNYTLLLTTAEKATAKKLEIIK